MCIFTARKRILRRLCFYTCLSFCSRGVSASVHAGIHTPRADIPREQTPPGADTLQSRHPQADTPQSSHPQEQTPTIPPGANTPLEQTPPLHAVHAGRYGQQAGGRHPTGMHPCHSYLCVTLDPTDKIFSNFMRFC